MNAEDCTHHTCPDCDDFWHHLVPAADGTFVPCLSCAGTGLLTIDVSQPEDKTR